MELPIAKEDLIAVLWSINNDLTWIEDSADHAWPEEEEEGKDLQVTSHYTSCFAMGH